MVKELWRVANEEIRKKIIRCPPEILIDFQDARKNNPALYKAFAEGDNGRDNVATLNDLFRAFDISVRKASYLAKGRKPREIVVRYDLLIQPKPGKTRTEFINAVLQVRTALADDEKLEVLLESTKWTLWANKYRAMDILTVNEEGMPAFAHPYVRPQLVASLDNLLLRLSSS